MGLVCGTEREDKTWGNAASVVKGSRGACGAKGETDGLQVGTWLEEEDSTSEALDRKKVEFNESKSGRRHSQGACRGALWGVESGPGVEVTDGPERSTGTGISLHWSAVDKTMTSDPDRKRMRKDVQLKWNARM